MGMEAGPIAWPDKHREQGHSPQRWLGMQGKQDASARQRRGNILVSETKELMG